MALHRNGLVAAVDANRANLAALEWVVRALDVDFVGFASPREALERIFDDRPDVVFVDFSAPSSDTRELMEKLSALRMPFVTVFAGDAAVPRAGATPTPLAELEKPLKIERFVAIVSELVRSRYRDTGAREP